MPNENSSEAPSENAQLSGFGGQPGSAMCGSIFRRSAAAPGGWWRVMAACVCQTASKTGPPIKQTEKQIEQLLDRIVDASSASVVGAYEKRIATLELEKLLMAE
jgi:hypothetical protein